MKYRIYHNPRCRKSREGLDYLKTKSENLEVREYLKERIEPGELKQILSYLRLSADELCRKKEADYKAGVKGKGLSEDDLINFMVDHPKLIERPVVVNLETKKAVIARPYNEIDKIL